MTVMQVEVSNSSRLSLFPSDTSLLKLLLMLQQRLSNATWSTAENSLFWRICIKSQHQLQWRVWLFYNTALD